MATVATIRDIPCYVINLEKDKERYKSFLERTIDVSFQRIEGIYGPSIDLLQYPEVHYMAHYFTPKTVLGCGLSHRKAIKTFLEEEPDKPYALICEDDAIPIHEDWQERIVKVINEAPSDWEIIKFDYYPDYNLKTGEYKNYLSVLATAYIISRSGAKKILDTQILYYNDVDLNFIEIKSYLSPERIFYQNWEGQSDSNNAIQDSSSELYRRYLDIYFMNYKVLNFGGCDITANDIFIFLVLFYLIYDVIGFWLNGTINLLMILLSKIIIIPKIRSFTLDLPFYINISFDI
jgi:glycosyl transferase family 25